jgi:hypothetical protein
LNADSAVLVGVDLLAGLSDDDCDLADLLNAALRARRARR